MNISSKYFLILITTIYQIIASIKDNIVRVPLGQLIDLGGYKVHIYTKGTGNISVILDHSLGGIEGYFLIDEIAKFTRVLIYDRPGYGWSDSSPRTRCSAEIVSELDLLLTKAQIEPPYILVGNSFGSYNVRLYAHKFPEKVVGIVLTDGLHERQMLAMPLIVSALKLLFISGFIMSIFGAAIGIIRLIGTIGIFELIKPDLKKFPKKIRQEVKKSFYNPKHWLTMTRELGNLNKSSRQVAIANNFKDLPIVSIKSQHFFKPTWFNFFLPLKTVDRLRDRIHDRLNRLSSNYTQLAATNSSHFVWVDRPEIIIEAIKQIWLL
ncbi:alpha/beta fold hydrolase [Myxosarcina sp. GI1]|uniref:alpha/beta fold hydrolase n=1 Tax=Myxosarcina sp. GI1 TaxID=1541065 RepID=UPI000B1A9E58|nr:alpha/beta hydrolase [Myxosarcina sp. GI1]